jgi:hypothetical protein
MLISAFLNHPRSVNETYTEHFRNAAGLAGDLIFAGFACALHALVPCWCEKTASRIVFRLHARLCERGRIAETATQDRKG